MVNLSTIVTVVSKHHSTVTIKTSNDKINYDK